MKVGLELSPVMVLILFLSFLGGSFFYGNIDSLIVYVRGQEQPSGIVKNLGF